MELDELSSDIKDKGQNALSVKDAKTYEERLTRFLLKIDSVAVGNDTSLRTRRKELVKLALSLQDLIEQKNA